MEIRFSAFAFFLLASVALGAAAVESHWNGGRTVPVHRLAPLDAQGDKVSFAAAHPVPVSLEKTCSQCHDVESMRGGSHFRTGLDAGERPPQCNFEPWFLVDEKSGAVTPISLWGQLGTVSPAALGMSAWGFTLEFARAFPGGGIASDARAMAEAGGEKSRWFVTGPLEVNCLACHQRDGQYDSSEWARQVLRQNWGGAALAASSLAEVGGMNSRLESSWDAMRAENPDDHLFKVPQCVAYDRGRFDAKGRCVFAVGKPRNENCLACHAVSERGMPSHAIAGDVHLRRGMQCIDCHKSGMDHRMVTTSCRDCHVAKGGAGPRPVHAGIPLVHFEKLACTVCHSGVTAGGRTAQVRTARANRIGVYGRAQWARDLPYVVEPVFVKNDRGVVEPCRLAWVGSNTTWTAFTWPFAHDVRPARQARGAAPEKCADCHSADSGFFFGTVEPPKSLADKGAPAVCRASLLKADRLYHRFFGTSFMMRPMLKFVMWSVFACLCLFGMAAAAIALRRVSGWLGANTDHFLWGAFKWTLVTGFVAAVGCLALTGVVGWAMGGMTGWVVVAHMVAGGGFAVAAALVPCFWFAKRTATARGALVWMLWTTFAAATVFSAVMPMMTVFGSHGQCVLLWSHRLCALAFVATSVIVCHFVRRRQ